MRWVCESSREEEKWDSQTQTNLVWAIAISKPLCVSPSLRRLAVARFIGSSPIQPAAALNSAFTSLPLVSYYLASLSVWLPGKVREKGQQSWQIYKLTDLFSLLACLLIRIKSEKMVKKKTETYTVSTQINLVILINLRVRLVFFHRKTV